MGYCEICSRGMVFVDERGKKRDLAEETIVVAPPGFCWWGYA